MTTVYQLTEKEKEIIEAYREVSENEKMFIESAARSVLKAIREPKQSAQIFEFANKSKE